MFRTSIETLNRDFKQQLAFRDYFDIAANEINNLTDPKKLIYLRSYVTGDAHRIQARLALTGTNYCGMDSVLQVTHKKDIEDINSI